MSVRSIEDWVATLKPLGYWDAADVILDNLDDYPKRGDQIRNLLNANREADKKQLGNALIAWAMLTAIEIEAELGGASPDKWPNDRGYNVCLSGCVSRSAHCNSLRDNRRDDVG